MINKFSVCNDFKLNGHIPTVQHWTFKSSRGGYAFFTHIFLQCLSIFFIVPGFIASHAQICLTVRWAPSFSLGAWALQRAVVGAFWHLRGVNSSPGEAVWLSHNPRPPRPRTQLSPKHSDSQMVPAPAGQPSHFFNYHSSRGEKPAARLSSFSGMANTRPVREEFLHSESGRATQDHSNDIYVSDVCIKQGTPGSESALISGWRRP